MVSLETAFALFLKPRFSAWTSAGLHEFTCVVSTFLLSSESPDVCRLCYGHEERDVSVQSITSLLQLSEPPHVSKPAQSCSLSYT